MLNRINDLTENGELLQVCALDELLAWQDRGWVVVGVIACPVEKHMIRNHVFPNPVPPDQHGYGYEPTVARREPYFEFVTETRFLLRKDRDAEIQSLKEEARSAKEERDEMGKQLDSALVKVRELEADVKSCQDTIDSMRDWDESRRSSIAEKNEKIAQLRDDIGVLRREVGEARARELLEEK